MDITQLAAAWPLDWILIGAFAALVSLDALRSGTGRAASVALVLPVVLFTLQELPKTAFLSVFVSQFSTPIMQAVLFAILFVIYYILIRRIVGVWSESQGGPMQALIAGVACTVVVVCMWLQVTELDTVWHFGAQLQAIFSESYRLLWLLAAYAALAYVRS